MAISERATRSYYNQFLDSSRWDDFQTRPGDIVVATAYKAGTTWTQNILLHLIFQDLAVRQIGGFEFGAASGAADLVDHGLAVLGIAAVDDDMGAAARQFLRRGAADVRRGTGDQGNPILKRFHIRPIV